MTDKNTNPPTVETRPCQSLGEFRRSESLLRELAQENGMLRHVVKSHADRLQRLADDMEEEGKALKILGKSETRISEAFGHGAEMCGAADMARDWAKNLKALLANDLDQRRGSSK